LALNETFLTSDIDDCELYIPGYKLARKDRTNSAKLSGGGVLIYIRDCIPFVMRTDLMDSETELLWQRRRNIDNWGGADIHIFVFTDCKNNRFQILHTNTEA
jgi:hypothetical protein